MKSNLHLNNLKRIKNFVEVLSSKGIEKEFNFEELKRFLKLTKLSKDFIETKITDSINLKQKLSMIISQNKSIENNQDLTKFLFYDIQREKNDFLFKNLFANLFTLIKKDDEDSSLIEYVGNINKSLRTVDSKLILKSELIIEKIKEITKEINKVENYKGIDTNNFLNYLSLFNDMGVDITREKFFTYHFDILVNEKLNSYSIINFHSFSFDYLNFFINFKNNLVDIKQRILIKNKFKINFTNQLMSYVNTENEDNNNNKIIYRFDQILFLLQNFNDDSKFVTLCEYILNLKLQDDICPINTLIEITNFYIQNKKLNKTIIHFISYNLMEHLRDFISIRTFEIKILPLFGIVCENCKLNENSETISEFLEEFKSSLFHNRFLELNLDEEIQNSNLYYINESIKIETLIMIKYYHNLLKGLNYFDLAFDQFLNKTINLNNNLSTIH